MEGGDYGERAAMPTEDDLGGAAEAPPIARFVVAVA